MTGSHTEGRKDDGEAASGRCGCKVGRTIETYDLGGLDDELVARRTGDRPASLRDLADRFNRTVLRAAIERVGGSPLDGEVANTYRLLTAEDVSSGTRVRVRKQLEREGVDLEAVEGSFVSHPTMGSHLRECLAVERPSDPGPDVATAEERIFKMGGRFEAVVGDALDGLAAADRLGAGELSVTLDAQVTCQDCGVHAGVREFIERGGCDCGDGEDG